MAVPIYFKGEILMKKRLHDKKAGIAILLALIIIMVGEMIFRAVAFDQDFLLSTANLGEQVAVVALAVTILILTAKGKDRAAYICYGAWVGYFVLDQIFELPGFLSTLLATATVTKPIGMVVGILYVVSMIGIIAIGALLVEYMNDGTICNRAFNTLCVITMSAIVLHVIGDVFYITTQNGNFELWLSVLNNIRRCSMIFLFTFFAYDSAKHQLKKTDLTK
jgi:hypothetical protein